MIERNFNLYLTAGHSVPLVINVNQYDSGDKPTGLTRTEHWWAVRSTANASVLRL